MSSWTWAWVIPVAIMVIRGIQQGFRNVVREELEASEAERVRDADAREVQRVADGMQLECWKICVELAHALGLSVSTDDIGHCERCGVLEVLSLIEGLDSRLCSVCQLGLLTHISKSERAGH